MHSFHFFEPLHFLIQCMYFLHQDCLILLGEYADPFEMCGQLYPLVEWEIERLIEHLLRLPLPALIVVLPEHGLQLGVLPAHVDSIIIDVALSLVLDLGGFLATLLRGSRPFFTACILEGLSEFLRLLVLSLSLNTFQVLFLLLLVGIVQFNDLFLGGLDL
jgi:hypothetical protein